MAAQTPDTYALDHGGDFDGYLAARAQADAEYEAHRATLPGRLEAVTREATKLLQARGALPPGFELTLQECP